MVRQIGVSLGDKKVERESVGFREERVKEDAKSSGVE